MNETTASRNADRLADIASAAYSIGYGSKLHQATLDMAIKLPGWLNFVSLSIGVVALVDGRFSSPIPAATLIIAGIGSIYFSHYQDRQADYDSVAKELLRKFYLLKSLAAKAESASDQSVLDEVDAEVVKLQDECKKLAITRQVFLASWYAHYKFFWQAETDWIIRLRKPPIRFWRDKMPLGATATLVLIGAALIWYSVLKIAGLIHDGVCGA